MAQRARPMPVHPPKYALARRVGLFLRGYGPLLIVALAVLAGPTLLVWWLLDGPFRWHHALIGGAASLAVLGGIGLALGWAVGRIRRGRPE